MSKAAIQFPPGVREERMCVCVSEKERESDGVEKHWHTQFSSAHLSLFSGPFGMCVRACACVCMRTLSHGDCPWPVLFLFDGEAMTLR